MSDNSFIPLPGYLEYPEDEMARRARDFHAHLKRRRTVREFSRRPVPREIIDACLEAATTAPSGANLQPWHFVVVSDAETKNRIRTAAEEEERHFYRHRAPRAWLDALAPLGTDEHKPFLVNAPWLIAIFVKKYGRLEDGRKVKHYYPVESVGSRDGDADHRTAPGGSCDPQPYPESDEVPERNSGPAEGRRAALSAARGGLSGKGDERCPTSGASLYPRWSLTV